MRRFTIWLFPILILGLLLPTGALAGDPDIPQASIQANSNGRLAGQGMIHRTNAQAAERVAGSRDPDSMSREKAVPSRGFESVEPWLVRLAAFWQLRLFR